MIGMAKFIFAGALAIAVAGCERPAPAEGGGTSQVLPGSASDAMIAYDTLRSQPPLEPDAVRSDAADGRTGPQAGANDGPEAATGSRAEASDAAAAPSGEPAPARAVPPASDAP